MNTPSEIQDLMREISRRNDCRRMEFSPLPSGVCFLRVAIGHRNFVLEYHPVEGTGVSENAPNTPAFVGHDVVFDSLNAAINHFKSLLDNAAHTANYAQEFALREGGSNLNKNL